MSVFALKWNTIDECSEMRLVKRKRIIKCELDLELEWNKVEQNIVLETKKQLREQKLREI